MIKQEPGNVVGIRVFVNGPDGGNPVPLVRNAAVMLSTDMQDVAQRYGHESAFVLESKEAGADWTFRFFVPKHEMEMCGHATVGALWALRKWGEWDTPTARVRTLSGLVDAFWDAHAQRVWVSQPAVTVTPIDESLHASIRLVLDPQQRIRWSGPIVNAATSRFKTLVGLASIDMLNALQPSFGDVENVCEMIASTGLYPYAIEQVRDGMPVVAARQFPKSSGYAEDAATGIAATALWGYLRASNAIAIGTPTAPVTTSIRQGEAMACPSAIDVQARFADNGEVLGCWLSGEVQWMTL